MNSDDGLFWIVLILCCYVLVMCLIIPNDVTTILNITKASGQIQLKVDKNTTVSVSLNDIQSIEINNNYAEFIINNKCYRLKDPNRTYLLLQLQPKEIP